jgi:hypothetical protein
MKRKPLPPVQTAMCKTCPFRDDEHALLIVRDHCALSALTECSRECHSTGGGDQSLHGPKRWVKTKLCRGARDLQLHYFHVIGFLSEPTDAAWSEKWGELQKSKRL